MVNLDVSGQTTNPKSETSGSGFGFFIFSANMSPLQNTLTESGKTMSAIAREIGVPLQDLSHFVRAEMDKVGGAKRSKIRDWMVLQGYLQPTIKPEICICQLCQSEHVKPKDVPGEWSLWRLRARGNDEGKVGK